MKKNSYLRFLLQSFDFLTLCTKMELVDIEARMRVLINKVFDRMPKLLRFKFLMVCKTALNFRFVWLKNKVEIDLFKNFHHFKIEEPLDLISYVHLFQNIFSFIIIFFADGKTRSYQPNGHALACSI